ncbi:hypothetical protein ACFOHY_25060 [Rhizobium rosettiformans]|jgi:hypothetical protein|uniref:hypothetical protein n=1 Tax=Rhizobium rosettiformans TaxID=1368430 RepID=UPI00361561F1
MASSSSGPARTETDQDHEAPPSAEPTLLPEKSKPDLASSQARLFWWHTVNGEAAQNA